MKIHAKKLLVLTMAIILLGTNIKALADEASAESRRFSVMSVSGDEAYVTKGSTREVNAVAGMPLGQGSKVRTGTRTSLYFESDDDKTIKMDRNTKVEITKSSSKKLKLTLKTGEMFFNVDKPLKDGEEMNFDAAQTSMSIRGTSGIFDFKADRIIFYLIEGQVEWNIGNQAITLRAGEKAELVLGTDEVLTANGMNSVYRLRSVEEYDWHDLDAFGLESVLEQRGRLDLTAIGLITEDDFSQAAARARELRAEKDADEEKIRQQTSTGVVRIDGEEPENEDGDDGESYTPDSSSVPEESVPDSSVPEETVPDSSSVPEETVPDSSSVPEETVPEETVPEETVPEETAPDSSSVPQETGGNDSSSYDTIDSSVSESAAALTSTP